MAKKRELISVKQAAEILNRSPAAIYKAIHDGRLHYADELHRLLDRKGLEERFCRSTRPRADCTRPAAPDPHPPEQHPIEADQWELIAQHCNELIDPVLWAAPPPWTAERWAGLAGVIDLARLEAEAEDLPLHPKK